MKIAMISLVVLGAAGAGVTTHMIGAEPVVPVTQEPVPAQQNVDADQLYDLVKQARADLREMRVKAGLGAYATGPRPSLRASAERGEGGAEHAGREGRGERGEHGGGTQDDEEGSSYLPKMTKQDRIFANGARLVLQFNPGTQVFVGSVTNTTSRTLSQVRVEIHLDNGTELGPTKRTDVRPGQTMPVELGAFGNSFTSWVSHPEAGVEQGHGAGGEEGGEGRGEGRGSEGRGEHGGGEGRGEGRGEHGGGEGGGEGRGEHGGGEGRGEQSGGEGARPADPAYRPLYNQLQILRGEMHAFEVDLGAGRRS